MNMLCSDDENGNVQQQEHTNGTRRSRRKASMPQKTPQLDSVADILKGSPEASSNSTENCLPVLPKASNHCSFSLSSYGDGQDLDTRILDTLELDSDEPYDIFDPLYGGSLIKGLQEEIEGELDTKVIEGITLEWKAQLGIKCNMCKTVFEAKTEFENHYQLNYNLSPVYTCNACDKPFSKYSSFRTHCYRHITEGRYRCKECPKQFGLRGLLDVHALTKHATPKPLFQCEECGKGFMSKPGLLNHVKSHNTEVQDDYPCVECGKVLHSRGGLRSHMNVHRLGCRFICHICGKTFTHNVNLRQHEKQHSGNKPHSCDKCEKSFFEKCHLLRHKKFHNDVRPYKCAVCEKTYKTERCLKVHSMVHSDERPFICEYCNKGFLNNTKLKEHCNTHTGERPFKCNYCIRTFTNYPNCLKHTRRSHKVEHDTGTNLSQSQIKKSKVEPTPDSDLPLLSEQSSFSPSADLVNPLPSLFSATQNQEQTSADIVKLVLDDDLVVDTDHLISDVNLTNLENLRQFGSMPFPVLDDNLIMSQIKSSIGPFSTDTYYFGNYDISNNESGLTNNHSRLC